MIRRQPFLLGAQVICLLALALWLVAGGLVQLVDQQVTYTVCSGPLLNIPPGTVHWPPIGHHLELIGLQHNVSLAAVGATVLGVFLVLYAQRGMGTFSRTLLLVASIMGSLLGAIVLGLLVQAHTVGAQVDALVRCL